MPDLQPLLARFLHVRRTELGRALQVSAFAMVLGWAMYTAFNASQAIFLAKAGPKAYPVFFIILALAVWPMVALQGAATRRLGVGRTFRLNLALNVVAAFGVYIAYVADESSTVAFAAYVVYSVAFELVMLQFWAFVIQHFNLLEGKRIFPVIAVGSSVGYILAGFTTTLVATVATEPLIFVWAFGAAVSAWMSSWLEKRLFRPAFHDDADEFLAEDHVVRKRRGSLAVVREAVTHLFSSRLVLALVTLAFVLQAATRMGDYLVALIFVRATHSNLQDLTILIGQAWLASYVVQLVIGLFVAPWVLDKLGVKNAILALPIFAVIGFAAVAVSPILATSLFLFIVRNGLQTGLDDPAQNVLSAALPAQVGPKLAILLNNAVLPGAAVVTGVGLYLLQNFGHATLELLAVIGVIVSCLFVLAALWVRGLYVGAIYQRLRTHAISLGDFQRALGSPNPEQVAELQSYVRQGEPREREFAAAALGRIAPAAFAAMLPELVADSDAMVRRLAFQMAPPDAVTVDQLQAAMEDEDVWVQAAVAVAGSRRTPPWDRAGAVLEHLRASDEIQHRTAAVWAASFVGDDVAIVAALGDGHPRVRLEAILSFAKMKGSVAGAAPGLIACLRDADVGVRRAALKEAVRWTPPAESAEVFATALVDALGAGDRIVRELAAEAMAAQSPAALEQAMRLLGARGDAEPATLEALIRSGRPELFANAKSHLEKQLDDGLRLARIRARLVAHHRASNGSAGEAFLQIALDDYIQFVIEGGLAAMRALHGKRGFATVERGVASEEPLARAEGLETLINFGPGWLATPLAQLLDRESFDALGSHGLSRADLEALAKHHDKWVKEGARAAYEGPEQHMKELIALKLVPLFSDLTLEQLSSIDRLMVTRHYMKGESLFRQGDVGSELFVVLDGEVRIHLTSNGTDVTLAHQGPNTVLGEMSVFDEQPRSASAQATTETTVRVLRRDRLQAIVHEHPEVLLEFVKNLSQRIRHMNDQLQEVTEHSQTAVKA
ncbi:MAG TPA: cyclic nucleotide-binding domain-containing protein [Candidatus Dormibacteraeota bacterium]|nr:cyclic nucleotide-binding domain-containing protein [Candidatus Dormibacteraeota bacterium]